MKSIFKFFCGVLLTITALFLITFSTFAVPTKLIDRNYNIETDDYFIIPSDTHYDLC